MRSRGRNGVEERGFLSRHMLLASSGVWMLIAILTGRRRGRMVHEQPAPTPPIAIDPVSAHSARPSEPASSPQTIVVDSSQRWLGDQRRCINADCVLLLLAAATVASLLLDAPSPIRLLLLLAAACLIPGSALLTLLPVEDPFEAFALAVGFGFTLETVGALAMVWTGWWHPYGWTIVLGALACVMLTLDLRRNLALIRRNAKS